MEEKGATTTYRNPILFYPFFFFYPVPFKRDNFYFTIFFLEQSNLVFVHSQKKFSIFRFVPSDKRERIEFKVEEKILIIEEDGRRLWAELEILSAFDPSRVQSIVRSYRKYPP